MKKILLVEDDTFLSKMYYDKLSRDGEFEVYTAITGEAAMEILKKTPPDLVLLDIMLPDINGVQILKQMRAIKEFSQTPVVMLTNLNEKDYINEALALGAAGYLIKAHFTPNEVIDKIKQILREE